MVFGMIWLVGGKGRVGLNLLGIRSVGFVGGIFWEFWVSNFVELFVFWLFLFFVGWDIIVLELFGGFRLWSGFEGLGDLFVWLSCLFINVFWLEDLLNWYLIIVVIMMSI